MPQKMVLGSVAVVIVFATALSIGWAKNRSDINLLTHRLATTQVVLAETQSQVASAQAQLTSQGTDVMSIRTTVVLQGQHLEQLRASVNHLCNVAAGNPVEVSPLGYTLC